MECRVPQIDSGSAVVTFSEPLEVHYGFNVDKVSALKNVSHSASPNLTEMLYYPDPEIEFFSEVDQTKQFVENQQIEVIVSIHYFCI